MTAYGRKTHSTDIGRFTVEIQTVNRKFLEININLPMELRRFDIDVRRWISNSLWCGQVNVMIQARFYNNLPLVITPNIALAKQLKKAWDDIADSLDIDKSFSLEMLKGESALMQVDSDLQNENDYKDLLKLTVQDALAQLVEMKEKEGYSLRLDFEKRLTHLQLSMEQIANISAHHPVKYKEKLSKRLEEVLPGCVENEDRLLRELVVFAERTDVAEEITRFNSHLAQFETLLNGKDGGVGKTMDFLTQEMNREINTLSVKATDLEISRLVVDTKSCLSKIREQIQNVE